MAELTPEQKRNYALNDCGPGWDDRKAVLDVFYDNGGYMWERSDLDAVYRAILAVSRHGAEKMYDYLQNEES